MTVASISPTAQCPQCRQASQRIHRHYQRCLQDLPLQGITVSIRWRTRRFFCDNAGCLQRVFTERLPEVASKYSRKTQRLVATLRALALECGGEAGSRLAGRLGMPASPTTLLREIRRCSCAPAPHVRVLGVDDWAIRRGQRYGTILVNLETHQTIDLLPDRSTESFGDWLMKHPEVEIISRDRGEYYIRGANIGAPKAIQVTDRWHLLHNIHEVLTRVLERFPAEISQAARQANKSQVGSPPTARPQQSTSSVPATALSPTAVDQRHRQRRARWEEKYQQVVELHRQKCSARKIAVETHLDRATVRRWLQAGCVPERAGRTRRNRLEAWTDYLESRWQSGCRNAVVLTTELQAQGFKGSYDSVRRFVASWRTKVDAVPEVPRKLKKPSAKVIAWWLLIPPTDRSVDQQRFVDVFSLACPPAEQAAVMAREFSALVRERNLTGFQDWMPRAIALEDFAEIQRFAKGLEEDQAAVEAALRLPWSNGQTEGQVNRVKLIKRQMFGRGNFDLLRRRVLAHGA
jgi:transposase